MLQEIFVDTSFGKVFGMSAGKPASPLVLAIHGWSQRNGWHTWQTMLQPLADAGYFSVSFDMPGWGKSSLNKFSTLDSDGAVTTCLEIIDRLTKQPAIIMGKSWGGGIAFQLALDHPHVVSKLIVSAPAYRNLPSLKSLVQPVLMAWAKDDPVIPIQYSGEYISVLNDLELVTYESGGHSAAPINSADFAPRAIKFLGEPISN